MFSGKGVRVLDIVEILVVVDMHEQRLPTARCHPERQFVEVAIVELGELDASFLLVLLIHELVEVGQKRLSIVHHSIEIRLRHQTRQHLERLQRNRVRSAFVECFGVRFDVLVVPKQLLGRQNLTVGFERDEPIDFTPALVIVSLFLVVQFIVVLPD
jgi:hypothetical protein